jgi:hypothetical protein
MTPEAQIIPLWPRWTASIGLMRHRKIQVRTQCRRCGVLMRADLSDLAGRYGANMCLIDRQERCRMVGCDGAAFYLATLRYGGPWHRLLADPRLIEGLDRWTVSDSAGCAAAVRIVAHGRPSP